MDAVRTDRSHAKWFNDDYLSLYAHLDERETRWLTGLIAARIPRVGGGLTLDLGCGAGRHLPFLSAHQRTVGLDLSPWLLDVARDHDSGTLLVGGDMRFLPFRDGAFTLAVNLFTSFGYFTDDAQNARVLAEVARVLAPGGWLVLDFVNAPFTRQSVAPSGRQPAGSGPVPHRRDSSRRFIRRTISLECEGKVFTQCLRLFEPGELTTMLLDCGYTVADICGDYSGRPLTAASPRAIILAQRTENQL